MSAFTLPDLGEGLHEAHLVEWHVKPGDHVALDQLVVSVETAKAIVDIPAPAKAKIETINGQPGDTIQVGEVLFTYSEQTLSKETTEKKESVSVVGTLNQSKEKKQNAYELKPITQKTESTTAPICMQAYKSSKDKQHKKARQSSLVNPRTRAFARKLGLTESLNADILNMPEQTHDISLSMLLQRFQQLNQKEQPLTEQIAPLSDTQKIMSQVLSKAHHEVVSTSLFDDADVSHFPEKIDISVTLIEALICACRSVPIFNAHYNPALQEMKKFSDVNVGLAVSSEHGLFVPVIKAADQMDKRQLRKKIDFFKKQIHEQTIQPKDLQGATISLSNIGTVAGKYATPIIVPPQVAILAVGKIRKQAVVSDDMVRVGDVLPLSLSFDHRLITGEEAVLFMKAIIDYLKAV